MGDVISHLFERDVVTAVGSDSARFLQGQLSQDVERLRVGDSAWSLLLQPGGKPDGLLRVTRTADDAFLLDVDPGYAEAVLARLSRFRIRVDCDLEAIPGYEMLALRGGNSKDRSFVEFGEAVIVAPVLGSSLGDFGLDLIGRSIVVPDGLADDPDGVERDRIRRGVPTMGAEIDDSVIPAELGAWLIDETVSFTKGCYVGQELVARVDSRGSNTPRHLRGLRTDGADGADSAVVVGATVTVGEKVVGSVTSVADNLALARLARSVEVGDLVRVDGQIDAVVSDLPFTVGAGTTD